MVAFYGYDKCATCRRAKALLQRLGIPFDEKDITTTPPPQSLLERILASGAYDLPELFNRSGELYRQMHMKEQLKTLPRLQLLKMLAAHGKLVKRPLMTDGTHHVVGLDEARIAAAWGRRAVHRRSRPQKTQA